MSITFSAQGKTRGLDQAIHRQAAWLGQTFGVDVDVRFHGECDHGGAFVSVPDDAESIGLCAGLIRPDARHPKLRQLLAQERRIYYAVQLQREFIKPSLQKYTGSGVRGDGYFFCSTLKEARALLLRKLDRTKLPSGAR